MTGSTPADATETAYRRGDSGTADTVWSTTVGAILDKVSKCNVRPAPDQAGPAGPRRG